jgi:hypothetical protein
MLTFAAGVAAAVVVMSIMPVLQSPPAGRTSHVKSMPGTPEIVAKSAPLPEPGPASPAQRMLDRFLRPSPRQLPAVIRYWEHEKQADPEDKAVWTKLASLYGLAADCAADPADQAGWRTKQEEAAEWLRQHPN